MEKRCGGMQVSTLVVYENHLGDFKNADARSYPRLIKIFQWWVQVNIFIFKASPGIQMCSQGQTPRSHTFMLSSIIE